MKVAAQLNQLSDAKDGLTFHDRVNLTKKEVGYVQQTAQCAAALLLRRLMSTWIDGRSSDQIAAPTVFLKSFEKPPVLALHRSLALHALCGQLYAFSGGSLSHGDLYQPLWLSLMLEGNGLRRMTADTAQHAGRLMKLMDPVITPDALGSRYVSDPWKAYRLGLFGITQHLLERGSSSSDVNELALRVRLATSTCAANMTSEINAIASAGSSLRISLLSSSVAYSMKQKREVPQAMIDELESWLFDHAAKEVTSEIAPLIAQVINAINLFLLGQSKVDAIETNMSYLLSSVTPRILSVKRRAHIEGNAYYQQSILARRRNDRTGELDALMRAMSLDHHFATLYYRVAQMLHDQGDAKAEPFYEMALALSPMDYATANDYGCWLLDSGSKEKFESWAVLCQALYSEQLTKTAGSSAS